MPNFKPNMMPILYWALAFGAAAGIMLFILSILSKYLTIVWFPVFLVGVIWGGWRNYQQQKRQWYTQAGVAPAAQSVMDEFRQAASDIASASQELLNQEESAPVESTDAALPQDDESVPPEGR